MNQEQWMELVRKQVQLIRENAVGVEAGRYVDFGEALEQGMVSLVSDITKSQIEAAEKRGGYWALQEIPDMATVREHIKLCEGRHTQQVSYSTYHGALTQVCFDCQKVRTSMSLTNHN